MSKHTRDTEAVKARVFEVITERGFVSGADLMQLQEADASFHARLASVLGVHPSEVRGLLEVRKISPDDVRDALSAEVK